MRFNEAITVLAIGGGGGGGFGESGGGGSGYLKMWSLKEIPGTSINIKIGQGGTSEKDGSDTIINSDLIAQGGKRGTLDAGGDGGSAGGCFSLPYSPGGSGGTNGNDSTSTFYSGNSLERKCMNGIGQQNWTLILKAFFRASSSKVIPGAGGKSYIFTNQEGEIFKTAGGGGGGGIILVGKNLTKQAEFLKHGDYRSGTGGIGFGAGGGGGGDLKIAPIGKGQGGRGNAGIVIISE